MVNKHEKNLEIGSFLEGLGFDHDESSLCQALVGGGVQTPLELSRATGIDRARVYRRLEHLTEMGVVDELLDTHTRRYQITRGDMLERLLLKREEETRHLRATLGSLKDFLSVQRAMHNPETKVVFYRGIEGVRRMLWNVLRAKGEGVGYTYRSFEELMGRSYLKRWMNEFMKRDLRFRDIYSDKYLESVASHKPMFLYSEKHFPSRYIPPDIINIDHQVDIYNDVVAYYNWYEGEVFGVELHNTKVARMQKQIFEIIWKMGEPDRVQNPRRK